ncbi:MAG: hypothetical protein K8823_712 [Cenarchaeum symbiont of Oopsacas minuta]|nr:hypothetical protein [Cenarchaeum symbiont of Oopsacas minuta]
MKLGTALIFLTLILGILALVSSGCVDVLIVGGDFTTKGFLMCGTDTFSKWSSSVVSDGYVHTIKDILSTAKDQIISYANQ